MPRKVIWEDMLRKNENLDQESDAWVSGNAQVSGDAKEEYEKCPPTEWGGLNLKSDKIFLSPILVEGFPENIDYMKEWGFK